MCVFGRFFGGINSEGTVFELKTYRARARGKVKAGCASARTFPKSFQKILLVGNVRV